ncbi:MAG: hypothetical protein K9M45_13885 [Kiritimatiellales bacterium]|nr:hypothetical protein [Kiritimatiellales bacterium]
MNRYRTILIFAAVLVIVQTGCRRLAVPHPAPLDEPVPDLITESEIEKLPPASVKIVDAKNTARLDRVELSQKQSFYDQWLSKIDRETLEKFEGSYTRDDLFSGSGDGSVAFSLNSAWILSSSNLPTAGLQMRMNPATMEYEVVGGELSLPKSGVGVVHERDEESGENKTYFNMKKNF